MKKGSIRKVILWVHLVAGLSAALVLIVIGLTGAVLAFSNDYGRWTNRAFFSVKPAGPPMSQDAIVAKVQEEYKPSRVESINIIWPDAYQYYFMNDRVLIVNAIDGRALDPRAGEAWTSKLVIKATELHRKLALGKIGQITRDIATYEVLILIPTGVILWWRSKRFGLKWKASWYKRVWDFHNTIGITIALPIFFLAFTGTLISLRLPESWRADSKPTPKLAAPQSTMPTDAAKRIPAPIDAAIAAADAALPGIPTFAINLPESPRSPIKIGKSEEGWSGRGHSETVFVDQYSGAVLRVDHPRPYSVAYEAYNFGKHLHGGEKFGTVGKLIFAISGVLLAVMALNGIGLGLWKLSGWLQRSQAKRR